MSLCCCEIQNGQDRIQSNFIVPKNATLKDIQRLFPYAGKYHFRAKCEMKHEYFWLDLVYETQSVPICANGTLNLKVLQLNDDGSDEYLCLSELDEQLKLEFVQGYCQDSNTSIKKQMQKVGKSIAQHHAVDTLKKHTKKLWTSAGKYFNEQEVPSEECRMRLDRLVDDLSTTIQMDQKEHRELLHRLWNAMNHEEFQLESRNWKNIGFQKQNPLVELRGVLSLQCLVYLIEVHASVIKQMVKEQSQEKATNYPLAAVVVNIVIAAMDALQLNRDRHYAQKPQPYWPLFEDSVAFFELVCIGLRKFDRFWKSKNAMRQDFKQILNLTKENMLQVLQAGPKSIEALVQIAYDS